MKTVTQKQAFIDAINAQAGEGDRLAEYVYADWLDEQGDPRAEAWRVLLEQGKKPILDYVDGEIREEGRPFDGWMWFLDPTYSLPPYDRYWFERVPFATLEREHWEFMRRFEYTDSYFKAMDSAALAWVRCYRDIDFI